MSRYSKKDYEFVAGRISYARNQESIEVDGESIIADEVLDDLANDFARDFANDNDRFDHDKFLEACK